MKLSDFINRLNNVKNAIEREAERKAMEAGADLAAIVVNRVIQTGKDSDGNQFSPYSNVQLPAFFYFNRSRIGSAESTIRAKAKDKEKVSYSDFRRINNLNTNVKNFEFTGAMWRSFRPISVTVTGGVYRVTIGASNPKEAQKLEWLADQEGESIVKPSQSELDLVQDNITKWINSILRQ